MQGSVPTSGRDQFLMGALLEDAAPLEVEDQIGAGRQAQVMSDPESRAPLGQSYQGVEDRPFVLLVEAGRGLVEDQEGGIADRGAGDRDPVAGRRRGSRPARRPGCHNPAGGPR